MFKMSFYDGTLDREKLITEIKNTKKPIKYTYGFAYRDPTTRNKPVSVEEAIEIVRKQSLLDADERDDYIHLNAYSSNDMW